MKQILLKAFMLMLVAVFAISAAADNTFTAADGNTYKWTINADGTTATLTGLQNTDFSAGMNLPDRVTADHITWYTVTEIKENAFIGDNTNSLTLPSTLVKIGANAFTSNLYFTTITIPSSVTDIGADAFQFCVDLKTVIINASPSLKIGDAAFDTDITGIIDIPGALESVIITSDTPPTLYNDPAYASETAYPYFSPSAKIYVPDATTGTATTSVQYKYKHAWSSYSSRIYKFFDKPLAGPYNAYYGTLALPYAVEIPTDRSSFNVYMVSAITKNEGLTAATMAKILPASATTKAYIPASTGVVLKSQEAYTPRFLETTETVAPNTTNKLQPCLTDGGLANDYTSYLTLGRDKELLAQGQTVVGFYLYTGTTIARNTAYMLYSDAGAKKMILSFGDDTPTAIKGVTEAASQSRQNAVYDLQGRRVQNPQKGIYIVNGKKVLY